MVLYDELQKLEAVRKPQNAQLCVECVKKLDAIRQHSSNTQFSEFVDALKGGRAQLIACCLNYMRKEPVDVPPTLHRQIRAIEIELLVYYV
jgi:hypothetical protein